MKSKIVFGLMILMTSSAFAVKEGGGGDSLVCTGFLGLFGKQHYVLADIAHADIPVAPHFFDYLTMDEAREGLFAYLNNQQDGQKVIAAWNELQFTKVDTLPNLNTGFAPSFAEALSSGCTKQQLAIQDPRTHEVSVYQPAYENLSVIEKVLLEFHEAYIDVELHKGTPFSEMEAIARQKTATLYYQYTEKNYSDFPDTQESVHGQNQLEFHLKQALYNWVGIVPQNLKTDMQLSKIPLGDLGNKYWRRKFHFSFFGALAHDPFFKACGNRLGRPYTPSDAHKEESFLSISSGELICSGFYNDDGTQACGDIQTVKQLYIRLLECTD